MATDIQIKKGDERDWRFVISDADGNALNLTSASVEFQLKQEEGHPTVYFERDTAGTGSDFISISDAANGVVILTPTTSDWADVSDDYGIYVGEFKVTDSSSVIQYTKDVVIDVQEALL